MIKKLLKTNKEIEDELRKERPVIVDDDGYRYPPPSAYEVKQITDELKLNSHMVSKVIK
jgi:hypothetical protein